MRPPQASHAQQGSAGHMLYTPVKGPRPRCCCASSALTSCPSRPAWRISLRASLSLSPWVCLPPLRVPQGPLQRPEKWGVFPAGYPRGPCPGSGWSSPSTSLQRFHLSPPRSCGHPSSRTGPFPWLRLRLLNSMPIEVLLHGLYDDFRLIFSKLPLRFLQSLHEICRKRETHLARHWRPLRHTPTPFPWNV